MTDAGYTWSIQPDGQSWAWTLADCSDQRILVQGRAPSRAVAAAMVVRAIARGMTTDLQDDRSLAA